MYYEYFNLEENPFRLNTDPRFLSTAVQIANATEKGKPQDSATLLSIRLPVAGCHLHHQSAGASSHKIVGQTYQGNYHR